MMVSEGDLRETVFANEILRGVVGSTVHGTAVDGQDDRDEMGVFIEPAENVCGLSEIEHYIYRDKPEGVRSEAGDLDLTFYSLRKFARLATQGNPSVLLLLWLPAYATRTDAGGKLIAIREAFISRDAGERYLGYLASQRKALTGERSKKVSRPELVEKYGYDTKFAMHALRLGFQGIEYLTERRLTLPVAEPDLSILRAVRRGEVDFSEAMQFIEAAEAKLKALVVACDWKPDVRLINSTLVELHRAHWSRS